jgi:hypothetical protein
VIMTDQFTVAEHGEGVTEVFGLYVTDNDATAPTDTFSMTASAGDGSVHPPDDSGSLADINSTLADGVTYCPSASPTPTDMVTLTVADGHGHSDIVNFIFYQEGAGPSVTLTGTDQKDVIFATGYNDTLTGGAKADQFVFSPEYGSSADTITDFHPGEDHIDLRAFSSVVDESNIDAWFAANVTTSTTNPADVVVTVGSHETITLKNVALNSLHASDFMVHA